MDSDNGTFPSVKQKEPEEQISSHSPFSGRLLGIPRESTPTFFQVEFQFVIPSKLL